MNPKHIGLFSLLLAAGVEFVVVGGAAVIAHGVIRATLHLDLFLRPTPSNAQAAFQALESYGAPTAGMTWDDLFDDEQHFRFGTADDAVDILMSIGDMPFDEVWCEFIEMEIDGLRVPFISKRCLVKNKIATGRHRDLADVEDLERLPNDPLPRMP